jgi:hypothetical protein
MLTRKKRGRMAEEVTSLTPDTAANPGAGVQQA